MPDKHYHYVITGAGCAGLSLAMHMLRSGGFDDKKILLVDESPKNANDRTWCFWERKEGLFEPIVFRSWEKLWFYGKDFEKKLSIAPYRYKMIRGLDFYRYCFDELKKHPNVQFLQAKVERIFSDKRTGIVVNGETLSADYVFNSILFDKPRLTEKQHWLLQHFKGWQIKTDAAAFDNDAATLMDFRIPQNHGTAFCYVLPSGTSEALVEYTLFTKDLLKEEEYDEGLNNYIKNELHLPNVQITETEFGVIPMTNYRFSQGQKNIVNIGTAGGQTKGSSGYTFYFIQQQSKAIVESLVRMGRPFVSKPSFRFHFYDSVLLHILAHNKLPGKDIFTLLFKKNNPVDVLQFLNNESSLLQELKIISSLPTLPFLKAAIRQIF